VIQQSKWGQSLVTKASRKGHFGVAQLQSILMMLVRNRTPD
jgi:hypothetical protein